EYRLSTPAPSKIFRIFLRNLSSWSFSQSSTNGRISDVSREYSGNCFSTHIIFTLILLYFSMIQRYLYAHFHLISCLLEGSIEAKCLISFFLKPRKIEVRPSSLAILFRINTLQKALNRKYACLLR